MNPEQQRIAIAEACGWNDIALRIIAEGTGMDQRVWCSGTISQGGRELPDYLNDLNAMHEAEKTLTPDTRPEYLCQLFDAATRGRSGLYPVDENYLSHHATASQRAEAFLRTIGKWEESK